MERNYIVVYVTTPNTDIANKIAKNLVETRLAACVNIIQKIQSIYRWGGKIEKDEETLLIIKSRPELFNELSKAVKESHPYEVPEIIALPIIEGNKEYLDWIYGETSNEKGGE